jgi:GMP synthase (glutamine-hydrolysing)
MGQDPIAMTRAIILQHTASEGAERVAALVSARGWILDVRHVYRGDPVPDDLGPDELLIVMGGPMGVLDAGDPRYPFLAPELSLLQTLCARDRPVLGICLGAQLLARAAGARVYPNTRPEVGWSPIRFLDVAGEPILQGLRERETLFQWHGDTFDLPPGAVHLAMTEVCAHQAFRIGTRQFGLQFHCEVGAKTIAGWVRDDADYVIAANGPDAAARIASDTARYLEEAERAGDRLLGNILATLSRADATGA